ncbi:hypothetical protein OAK45_03325 [Verrucomicrobia bacterium]|nr:hypothetical protein [Verrucomicrobiota bacterium]MDC0218591.1 hypothetical protein [Verrucomicrobiota bacterium]
MKKILIPSLCALVLTISCGKNPTTPTNNTNPAQDNTNPAQDNTNPAQDNNNPAQDNNNPAQGNNNAAAPLEPPAQPLPAPKPSVPSTTSFAAVTKHLDAGGDFYLYWNANQLQAFAQDGLEKLEEILKTEMPPDMRGEADTYMKLAEAAYIESGLNSIDGFGASSFRSGTGLRRHKVMIHRNPAKSDGLMWKALGSAPHELGGLKLMPATTAYAVHADLDVAGTFKWMKGFIASNLPAKQGAMLAEMLEEANAEVPIEKIINATGGELGMYVTLNPKKMIEIDPRMLEMLDIGGGPNFPDPAEMEAAPMPEDAGEAEGGIDPEIEELLEAFESEPSDGPPAPGGFDDSCDDKLPPTKGERAVYIDKNRKIVESLRELTSLEERHIKVAEAAPPPGFHGGQGGFGHGGPEMPKIKVPEPGLVLVLKVKDNTITDLLAPLLEQAGAATQQVDGVTMHTIPVPVEDLPIDLSPTLMHVGDYLVFSTTADLAKQVIAIHGGKDAGLAGTEEFKKLTNGLDLKANMITYMSSQISETFREVAAIGMQEEFRGAPKALTDTLTELNAFFLKSQVSLLSVTNEGYLIQNQTTGHIPMDMNIAVAISAVPVAVAAAAAAPAALPALAKAKAKANRMKSVNNMRQINNALQAYAHDHGGKLPPADKWCDAIMREVGSPIIFVSPSDPEAMAKFERGEKVSSYAFNTALAGKNIDEVFDGRLVMVFECNLGWNGTGGLTELRKHVPPDQWNIGTIDGAVMQTNPNMLQRSRIKWKPENDR